MDGSPKLCALHASVGRQETCPGNLCPFWEEGGAVVESGCAIERLALGRPDEPALAAWLLDLRGTLEAAASQPDAQVAWSRFHRRLAAGHE
jgi:hypothetical protein